MNYNQLKTDSVAKLFKLLREFGKKALPLLFRKTGWERNQYMVASIVSLGEIENEDFRFIVEPRNTLERILTDNEECDSFENYSLCFERIVVLLNLPDPSMHGEERLLDPDGRIRRNICNLNAESSVFLNDIKFLDRMKSQFFQKFRTSTTYLICIFSHYVPCMLRVHACAKLIDEYVRKTNDFVIVSSEHRYWETDSKEAWTTMKQNPNIFCLAPKHYCPSKQSEEFIESYLLPWDGTDEPAFRTNQGSNMQNKRYKRYKSYKPKSKLDKSINRQLSYDAKYCFV